MINYKPKLGGWAQDIKQPLEKGELQHPDLILGDNLHALSAKALPNVIVEVNGVLDLRPWCSTIEDQGHIGSCVGNGTVGALEFLQIRNGVTLQELSRLFIYYNARLMTQEQDQDVGCYIRIAFATLSSLGTCSEAKWPYDVSKVFIRPSWGAYREAYPNKITSFYRIASEGQERIEDIKFALRSNHPIVFGMIIDDEYQKVGFDGRVLMPGNSRANPGGHCQMIVGYDNNTKCWLVRNSWGKNWACDGYAWAPWAYLDASEANDFWVPTLNK